MIRIGLSDEDKINTVKEYISRNDIIKTFIFYFKDHIINYNIDNCEYIEYNDIEKEIIYYRLINEIDSSSLVIIDNCMRLESRNELKYNCIHQYVKNTEHRLIFEYFPFIDSPENFMILLDMQDKDKYKLESLTCDIIDNEDIIINPHIIDISSININVSEIEKEKYRRQKNALFNNLGDKDPYTIPRNLENFVGSFKKHIIEDVNLYVARNNRFNTNTYSDCKVQSISIDLPYKRIHMNDYIKKTKATSIKFIKTDLPIDNYYFEQLLSWYDNLIKFYDYKNSLLFDNHKDPRAKLIASLLKVL